MTAPANSLDVKDVEALLARIEPLITKADYECLKSLVVTLLAVTRLLRQHGARIAWLRRMLGQTSSEKTANVVGTKGATETANDSSPATSGQDEPVADQPSAGESKDTSANDTSGDAKSGDAKSGDAKKPRREERRREERRREEAAARGSRPHPRVGLRVREHPRPASDAVQGSAVPGVRARHAARPERARRSGARLRPGAARGAPVGVRAPALQWVRATLHGTLASAGTRAEVQ